MRIKFPSTLHVSGLQRSFGAIATALDASRWSKLAAVLFVCVIGLGFACPAASAQADEWAWMSGSSTVPSAGSGQPGVYATTGTFDPRNVPGGRDEGAAWTDSSGNLWIFGGNGFDADGNFGMLNDLWEFNPTTKEWAWMGGGSVMTLQGGRFYGNPGVYAGAPNFTAGNIPGGRTSASIWIDGSGNVWLFGGNGMDSAGNFGELNDLWEFSPSLNEWAWKGGSSTLSCSFNCGSAGQFGEFQSASTSNIPSGRDSATSWVDSSGNFWLMGGEGEDSTDTFGYMNDIWEFVPSAGTWAWMGGSSTVGVNDGQPGVYGEPTEAGSENVPGGRFGAVGWTDSSGHLWMFGGYGFDEDGNFGPLNDVWEFYTSNDEWAWEGGSETTPISGLGQPGVYGKQGNPAVGNIPGGRQYASGWTDNSGNFWLFGGYGGDQNTGFNDLWVLNPATDEWAWMDGSSTGGQAGVYGKLGTAAATNDPGGRSYGTSVTDTSGHLWLFGGYGADANGTDGILNDFWEYAPSTTETPALTTPIPGTQLTGTSVTFGWTPGTGIAHYELWLGTTGSGSTNLYNSGSVTATSETVSGLPNAGQTVYARLYWYTGGSWQSANYTYTAVGTPTPAALSTPTPSTTLTGTSVAFTWTPGNVATNFELWVGSTAGANNIYTSGSVTVTTETVSDLPSNSQPVYVRLYSLINGVWQYSSYTYTATGSPTPAALTTPAPSSTLTGTSVAFAWNPGNVATHFELWVGTSAGTSNVYNSGSVTVTTETVTDVPLDGQPLYVRLYSYVNGAWQYSSYSYSTSGSPTPAALITPAPSSTLTGTSVSFAWSPGNVATHFELWVGNTVVGSSNIYNSGSVTATTETVTGLQDNDSPVYVRLYSLINGAWQYTSYTYTSAGTATKAALTTPSPGTQLTGTSVSFSWTPGNSATHFELWLGSTGVGSSNLYNSGSVTATTETVNSLPNNSEKVYARLYSLINGAWQSTDYTYTAF